MEINKDGPEIYRKFYQTGFCKFKEKCRKKHEYEVCQNPESGTEKDCIKRHPKLCRNFSKYGKCVHSDKCAYKHTEYVNDQLKVFEAMMTLIMKQQQDISTLKEEVNDLKMLFRTIAKNTKDKYLKKKTNMERM